ncbi:MAG TPA: hypothetical protein VFE78_10445 [Gemmataceae bacterium]|jgi:hypothetical protein|nr:hypothetical protein [Gemmataceae bacterium]
MKDGGRLLWLTVGLVLGAVGVGLYLAPQQRAQAAANDRYDDYILCTGAVAVSRTAPTEGVWLLDYRAGKLLGTLIDRNSGKIGGFAEVDLVSEFGLPPRQNVHFMMTTGMIAAGQSALYVCETTSGKFGVYTMGVRTDGQPGVQIKRHDLVLFRQAPRAG